MTLILDIYKSKNHRLRFFIKFLLVKISRFYFETFSTSKIIFIYTYSYNV